MLKIIIDLLSQAGFGTITISVESGSQKVLRDIGKVCKTKPRFDEDYFHEKRFLSKVKEAISIAKRYNVKTEISIILGLPGETYEGDMKTIEFVRSLDADYYNHNYLVAFPGTEIIEAYLSVLSSASFLINLKTSL
ncbi:MAG: radical SAM protein [Methanotrichaceae archaeon]